MNKFKLPVTYNSIFAITKKYVLNKQNLFFKSLFTKTC